MTNELFLEDVSAREFKNAKLNAYTKQIFKIGADIKQNYFKVANIMRKVGAEKCYEEDGFADVVSWSMETFGFKKSFAYNLIKIGNEFLDAKGAESNLPHTGADFTPNQIARMLPLKSHDKVVEMVNDGRLTPEMTCKEVEEAVKEEIAQSSTRKPRQTTKVSTHVEIKICERCGVYFAKIGKEEHSLEEAINIISKYMEV